MKAPISYDTKCFELAQHFLSDFPELGPEHADQLAQDIQMCVEDYLSVSGPDVEIK